MNYLIAPVTITVDGTAYGAVACCGATTQFAVPATASTFVYVVGKSTYSNGSPIADDITGETLTLPHTDVAVNINNIIGGTPYFTPAVSNTSSVTVGVAIFRNSVVTCLGSETASTLAARWGYWRYASDTEMRLYQNTDCSGRYLFWSSAQLASYAINSGFISLVSSTAP